MKKKLLRNLGLKLLSVMIAVVLWFVVVMTNNPKDTKTFYDVPVKLVNVELLAKEGKVYEVLDGTDLVRVTVEMPRNRMGELTKEDIVAEADVSKLTEINTVPITCSVINPDLNISDIKCSRDAVRLSVEEEAKKWLNVQAIPLGNVGDGYVVDSIDKSPTRIQIVGPKSAVDKVSSVVAEVDVTNAISNVTVNVEPLFYDAEGNLLHLPSVTKNEDNIHVEVKVLATKEVPLELSYMGQPAEGYLVTGRIDIDPPTVLVAGTLNSLVGVNKITIPAEEIDITGATEDYTTSVSIRKHLPDNLKLVEVEGSNGRANVTVGIEPEAERTLTIAERNISIESLPEGFEADFEQEAGPYRLTISGLNSDISGIDQGAVRGTVNVAAWMESENMSQLAAGTYRLPVSFEFPEEIRMENELFVRLTIVEVEEE